MKDEMAPYTLLVVEDEDAIRENYVAYLQHYFKAVYSAKDGELGYRIYKDKKPNIMIVDINMPRVNGIELIRKIREHDHNTKIIILTAHADRKFLLEATELYLTKYLIKPISRTTLKDALKLAIDSLKNFTVNSNKLVFFKGNLFFNCETKELFDGGREVYLTKTETQLVSLLAEIPNRTFSYSEIIDEIWYLENENRIASLKTLIKNLRKKLPDESIVNVFGVGYKLVC